jgi:hypothetical protein
MSDENIIMFPTKEEPQEEADARADLYYVISIYFYENFARLFEETKNEVPKYLALLTLTEVLMYHYEMDNLRVNITNNNLEMAMEEGLHEHIIMTMNDVAESYKKGLEDDLY